MCIKKFASVLILEIEEETNSKVLNISTCSLHPVHTSFRKGLKKLNFDFDEFFHDMHFFSSSYEVLAVRIMLC